MESPKLTVILIVLQAMCIPAQRIAIQGGNMLNFAIAVSCANPNTNNMRYSDYGCFCGFGGNGNQPVDDIDRCCQVHDDCYSEAEKMECSIQRTWYGINCENEIPKCVPSWLQSALTGCNKKACECDVEAALCFKKHSDSFNTKFVNYDQELCKFV